MTNDECDGVRKPKTLRQLQAQVDVFNATHSVGSEVLYHPVIGDAACVRKRIRCLAFVLSGHTAVCFLEDKSGCVALDALTDPCTEEENPCPKPPKLSRSQQRYQEFLTADSGVSFIEWLKYRSEWKRRQREESAASDRKGR